MDQLSSDVASLRSRLEQVKGRRMSVEEHLEGARAEVRALEDREELLTLVVGLFRTLIDDEVAKGVKAVEDLMTEGLQAVFDDQDIKVRAEVDVQRGKVSVDFITVQSHQDGTTTEGTSQDAFGGAVTTVQSVLMRIMLTLRRGMRPLILLDESLPAFDANYVHNMGKFLRLLCERLNMDILLVTHNSALVDASHKAYRIHKSGGVATFREVR